MDIVRDLKSAKGLYVDCPSCQEPIALKKALLFDATRSLPSQAAAALAAERNALRGQLDEVALDRQRLAGRVFRGASSGRIGKRLEMIGASLPGLPVAARDCRALSDPIDYVAFEGVSSDAIAAVHFVEVKSEKTPLSPIQQAIKSAVERGSVSLVIADHHLRLD
jgi:predicted Holliday junction resolvase-like endonuclease